MKAELRERFVRRFGPSVIAWCDELPLLVDDFCERWGLAVQDEHGGGTSRVYRCLLMADATSVWLKLTPDPVVAQQEAVALRAWAGRSSVVGLLDADLATGALLLAGVQPGRPLRGTEWELPDVGRLLADLRRPVSLPSDLPTLAERVDFIFDLAERRGVVAPTARAAALELAASGPPNLVHGDLHLGNVLLGDGFLVAIDPRPCIGDPDFDLVDWALAGVTNLPALQSRIAVLAELVPGASSERVLAWCKALAPVLGPAPMALLR